MSALKRIERELIEIKKDPPVNCSAGPEYDDIFEWRATIIGPSESPFENGVFFFSPIFKVDFFFLQFGHCTDDTKKSPQNTVVAGVRTRRGSSRQSPRSRPTSTCWCAHTKCDRLLLAPSSGRVPVWHNVSTRTGV